MKRSEYRRMFLLVGIGGFCIFLAFAPYFKDSTQAKASLEAFGYRDVEVSDSRGVADCGAWCAGFDFVATTEAGQMVDGVACCRLFGDSCSFRY